MRDAGNDQQIYCKCQCGLSALNARVAGHKVLSGGSIRCADEGGGAAGERPSPARARAAQAEEELERLGGRKTSAGDDDEEKRGPIRTGSPVDFHAIGLMI